MLGSVTAHHFACQSVASCNFTQINLVAFEHLIDKVLESLLSKAFKLLIDFLCCELSSQDIFLEIDHLV